MTIAIYPGSFDPFTNGHLDVLKSGAEIFDKVIIVVSYNLAKEGFLTLDVRKRLIQECIKDFSNVEVDSYTGLTVDYAKKVGAQVLLRGLRSSEDFEYEMQMAQTNQKLQENIKTVCLITKPEHSFISSSVVREIIAYNGDVSELVPPPVFDYFNNYKA